MQFSYSNWWLKEQHKGTDMRVGNMSFEARLTLPENLYWAWLKYRRHLEFGDFWYDEAEVARFEGNLKGELEQIATQFKKLRYKKFSSTPITSS